MTLIISGVVLLVLIVGHRGLIYRSAACARRAMRRRLWATPVGELNGRARPLDAQPVDPEGEHRPPMTRRRRPRRRSFAPPPEAVQPRPEPQAEAAPLPPARRARDHPPRRRRRTPRRRARRRFRIALRPPRRRRRRREAPRCRSAPSPPASVADREYAAVAAAFPEYARGRTKGVEQVTSSIGLDPLPHHLHRLLARAGDRPSAPRSERRARLSRPLSDLARRSTAARARCWARRSGASSATSGPGASSCSAAMSRRPIRSAP